MERYEIGRLLGEGSFGTVHLAVHKETGQQRAIKVLKGNFAWNSIVKLRELQSLMRLHQHPFLVGLYEVHQSHDGHAAFVFEYMSGGSLYDFIREHREKRSTVAAHEIASLAKQAFAALDHMHQQHIIHRDIKPDNILLQRHHGNGSSIILKLADFSLARGMHEDAFALTAYISTRWYRAPEVLLGSIANRSVQRSFPHTYGMSMDVFAMGSIVAELFRLRPLFAGQDELQQLQLIINLLGPLPASMTTASRGSPIVQLQEQDFSSVASKCPRTRVEECLINDTDNRAVSFEAADLVFRTLELDPINRLTSSEAVKHAFLSDVEFPIQRHTVASTPHGRLGQQSHESCTNGVDMSAASSRTQADDSHVPRRTLKRGSTVENVPPGLDYSPNANCAKFDQNPYKRVALTTPETQHQKTNLAIPQVVSASPQFRLRIHDNSHLLKEKDRTRLGKGNTNAKR